MTTLLVARHGQIDWNLQDRYAGTADVELNDEGLRQAEVLARAVQRYSIDALVSSPMRRALQTAEVVAKFVPVEICVMPEFVERSVGVFDGLTRDEARQRYPELWEQRITQQLNAAPPDGESILEVAMRVRRGLEKVAHLGVGSVLVVTHAFVARMIFGLMTRPTDNEFFAYRLGTGEFAAYDLPENFDDL